MTAAEKELRSVKASLECLLNGWSGALLSADAAAESRHKARLAATAARRAVASGATPYQAVLEHVAPVFKTAADLEAIQLDSQAIPSLSESKP